jgi:hypothetical protein
MTQKTKANIVEMIADDDDEQAFDQACGFENRVGSHSTYCHNKELGYRKCYYRWTNLERHKLCEGFKPNEAYNGDWEDAAIAQRKEAAK